MDVWIGYLYFPLYGRLACPKIKSSRASLQNCHSSSSAPFTMSLQAPSELRDGLALTLAPPFPKKLISVPDSMNSTLRTSGSNPVCSLLVTVIAFRFRYTLKLIDG